MKIIKSFFKLLSFVIGVCTYSTVIFGGMVMYGMIKTKVFEYYPNIKYPDLVNVVIFIGTMGIFAVIYGKIKDYFFDEPTIKIRITKTKTETL